MFPDFSKYVVETTRKLEDPGLLLVSTDRQRRSNVMTIGWGFFGIFWRMPVFVVAVRPSRYTHGFIEERGEFTVNVPKKSMDDIVAYCGKVSGREHDKLAECELSLARGKKVRVPVLNDCKIHYECRVVHKLEVVRRSVPANVKKTFYSRGDYHTMYFGRIIAAY